MLIFEVTIPGVWINSADIEWNQKIGDILQRLTSQFFDANVALNLFEESSQLMWANARGPLGAAAHHERFLREADERHRVRMQIRQELGIPEDARIIHRPTQDQIDLEADLRIKKEGWRKGRVPSEFIERPPFLHAHAFLFALDGFGKFLKVLDRDPLVPAGAKRACAEFKQQFPNVTGVRDTLQHMENRALGQDRNGDPLKLRPVDTDDVKSVAGGFLGLGNLHGSKLSATTSDGRYVAVDVSADSMERLRDILNGVMAAFAWKGIQRHLPSAGEFLVSQTRAAGEEQANPEG